MIGKHRRRSRRGNHEGCIIQRSDGLFRAAIMYCGDKKYHYSRQKQDCHAWLAEQQLKFRRGQPITNSDITLLDWLRHFMSTYCEGYVRPATLANYELYAEGHIARSNISGTPISKLSCDHIQLFLNSVRRLDGQGELSQKTIRNMYVYLKSALEQARICGLTNINAAEGVRLKKSEAHKRPLLTDEQIESVLQAAGTHAFAIGLRIQATIGLRTSEVLALRQSSLVSVDGIHCLNIEYAVKREPVAGTSKTKTKWILSEPKTAASKALVPIPDFLYQDLIESIKAQEEQSKKSPLYKQDPFICGDPDTGDMISPDRYRSYWIKLREQAGLPKDAVLHCLRHYAASSLIRSGASPVATARILRHAQNSTTLNFYAHENLSGAYEAVKLIDK